MDSSLQPTPSADWQLYLFGKVRLVRAGAPVQLPTRKTEALLAFLAVQPGEHSRERLASLFWGDAGDQAARRSLRVALNALRKCLDGRFLSSDRASVQLSRSAELWVDAVVFQEQLTLRTPADLEAAIRLYQGDFMAEHYDDWALEERQFLQSRYLETLLQFTRHLHSQSNYAGAIGMAQKALQVDPANESAHQHLMLSYHLAGDRTAALRQYQRCRQALLEQVGVAPSPETEALFERVQRFPETKSASGAVLNNLPSPLTSFIGRQKEIAHICDYLGPGSASAGHLLRLLTLSGPAGSGKSRLAIQAGRCLLEAFSGGVWWVELATLNQAKQVAGALARALGVRENPPEPILETLVEYLNNRQVLLILDNCDHMVAPVAHIAYQLLSRCPHIKILATSREPLGLAGESLYQISPMPLPLDLDPNDLDGLSEVESVQLFVERARNVQADFRLTPHNCAAVREICLRLDGIPLALELAAARVRLMSAQQIAERLKDRFNLLVGSNRAALPHQQTLQSLIDWSYDLLSLEEQALFCQLGVFAGVFKLEDVEAVCDTPDALGLLARLIDKSLVAVEHQDGLRRFHLLETLRTYALHRLEAAAELPRLRDRHVDHYLKLAEMAEYQLLGQGGNPEFASWLESEPDNMRTALETALQHRPDKALRMTAALSPLWDFHGAYQEGAMWLRRSLQAAPEDSSPAILARAYSGAGTLTWRLAEFQHAGEYHQRALALFREVGDAQGVAFSLNNLGVLASDQGDAQRANRYFQEGLAVSKQSGDLYMAGFVLNNLGLLHTNLGAYSQAEQALHECINLASSMGEHYMLAGARHNLGDVARFRGDLQDALAQYRESQAAFELQKSRNGVALNDWGMGMTLLALEHFPEAIRHLQSALREFGEQDDRGNVLACLEGLAKVTARHGTAVEAVVLFAAVAVQREGIHMYPHPNPDYQSAQNILAELRANLEAPVYQIAWERGAAMTLAEVLTFGLSLGL
ncbi:MAG: tetratricopeptide repeat protein [Chloroflexota bacterium]